MDSRTLLAHYQPEQAAAAHDAEFGTGCAFLPIHRSRVIAIPDPGKDLHDLVAVPVRFFAHLP